MFPLLQKNVVFNIKGVFEKLLIKESWTKYFTVYPINIRHQNGVNNKNIFLKK